MNQLSQLHLDQEAGVEVVRCAVNKDSKVTVQHSLNPRGAFVVEHWRNGKRINEYRFPNGITNEGKNKLLDVMFHGTTAITTWWLGMIGNSGYTALVATDTYENINQVGNGWDEFTDYTDAANGNSASTRPEWTEGAAATQAITNASPVIFDITASGTVKGLFLVGGIANAHNKGDHTAGGILWATALFTVGDVPVNNGDQLKVTYSVSA
jgi:hypothetical protein